MTTTDPQQKKMTALEDALKKDSRGQKELPEGAVMTRVALDILKNSETALSLVEMVAKENIAITVIKTPQETCYIPATRQIYIGVTSNHPTPPPRFVLMLAGALRETAQELQGWKHPDLHETLDKHLSVSTAKEADKIAHLCAIAYELNALPKFSEYWFLDELRKMGHSETLDIFLANI